MDHVENDEEEEDDDEPEQCCFICFQCNGLLGEDNETACPTRKHKWTPFCTCTDTCHKCGQGLSHGYCHCCMNQQDETQVDEKNVRHREYLKVIFDVEQALDKNHLERAREELNRLTEMHEEDMECVVDSCNVIH